MPCTKSISGGFRAEKQNFIAFNRKYGSCRKGFLKSTNHKENYW